MDLSRLHQPQYQLRPTGPLEYIQRAERADFDGYEPFSSVEGSSAKS